MSGAEDWAAAKARGAVVDEPPPPDDGPEPTEADDPRAASKSRTAPLTLPFLWVAQFGEFFKPEPLRWLLTDTRTDKPFLRAGKCFVLGADGGAGKGFFWLELAVAIVLGRDLFETFRPQQQGPVAILAAEDDRLEIHHRLVRIANALRLDHDDIQRVQERVGIFPLSGEQVSLLSLDQSRNPQRTAVFEALVDQLTGLARDGRFEWAFIGLDPLARFGAVNVEVDQASATAFVAALESMALRLPGEPAIGLTHHSSASSVRERRANLRGVTGLRNAFRLAMLLDAVETEDGLRGVLLRNDKNNLAPVAPPLWLVRQDNEAMLDGAWLETAGVLRRASAEEIERLEGVAGTQAGASREQREQAKTEQKRTKFEAECDAVAECLPVAPRHLSREQLSAALAARGQACSQHTLETRIAALAQAGRIVDLSGGGRQHARQYARRSPAE